MQISSIDTDTNPLSTLAVLVKSGPIYESYDNLGVSHALRLSAGCTTKYATVVDIVRNIQQIGGQLNITGSREYMLYTLTMAKNLDNLNLTFDLLNEVVCNPAFKPWDLHDWVNGRLADDVASLDMSTYTMELLHKAAYRKGLGNSLYCPKFMISGKTKKENATTPFKNGKHTSEVLQEFHSKTHTFTRYRL